MTTRGKNETGATVVEYGVMVAAFGAVLIALLIGLGESMPDIYTAVMGGVETRD